MKLLNKENLWENNMAETISNCKNKLQIKTILNRFSARILDISEKEKIL